MIHEMDWVGRYTKGTKHYQIAGATVVKIVAPTEPQDRIQISCNDVFESNTFNNACVVSLIDEAPMWSNPNSILYWDFNVKLYHSNGEIDMHHEGISLVSPYSLPFPIYSLSFYSSCAWLRDINGNIRGDIVVRAFDHAGHVYECTKQIGVKWQPDHPEILYFEQWDDVIELNLKNDGASSYNIYYGTESGLYNGIGVVEGNSPVVFNAWDDIKLTGLAPNTTWHIAIQGYNELGSNTLSQDYSIYVQENGNVPSDFVPSICDSIFTLTWSDIALATSYKVYICDEPDTAFYSWTNIATVMLPYYEYNTSEFDKQFFKVVAVNEARQEMTNAILTPDIIRGKASKKKTR